MKSLQRWLLGALLALLATPALAGGNANFVLGSRGLDKDFWAPVNGQAVFGAQVDFARFLAVVEKIDQVIECHLVSGGYDYLMKFVTAGIGEYQTIMERLTDMDIGIDKYFSFVVLKSPIVKTHMPLPSLFPM